MDQTVKLTLTIMNRVRKKEYDKTMSSYENQFGMALNRKNEKLKIWSANTVISIIIKRKEWADPKCRTRIELNVE